jgi:hypothetical protein
VRALESNVNVMSLTNVTLGGGEREVFFLTIKM